MKKILGLMALSCLATTFADTAFAQTHFTECVVSTGENATVLVNDAIIPSINGTPLASGDEMAVYTAEGLCVGVEVWTGINIALTVWGDNSQTTEKDGLSANEQMNFVVWDASAQTEYGLSYGSVTVDYSDVAPYNGTGRYSQDAIYQLSSLEASFPQEPIAVISASAIAGDAPLLVDLDGSSSSDQDGTIVTFSWDFGDGSSALGSTVQHLYATAGSYVVVLTVTDNDNFSSTDSVTINVTSAPTNLPPTASFSVTPTSGQAPHTVSLDASSSSDSDGSIVTYSWAFGDGATATGIIASHVYLQSGTYTVELTVMDNDGASATASQTVTVSAANNQPPVAAFTSSATSGVAPLVVSFDATGSSDVDGSISSYNWDFGDGSTASGSTTSKTFTVAGTFNVSLTVADDDGASSTTQQSIVVSGGAANVPPVAAFSMSPTSGQAPITIAVDASASTDSDGTISSYAWDFGDGSAGSAATASHTFSSSGTYTVTLTVTDNNGATNSTSQPLSVAPPTGGDTLVLHLPFDESSGQIAADASGNANVGTLQNGAIFVSSSGVLQGAVQLDGAEAYVDVADAAELNQEVVSMRTVAVWFKSDDVTTGSRKQVIWEEGGQQKGLSVYLYDGLLFVGGWNRSTGESGWDGTYLSTSSVASNEWNHVSLVLNGGPTVSPGALIGYLNGNVIGSGEGSQVWTHNDDIGIGRVDGDTWFHDASGKNGSSHGLSGYIDDLRVYNRALSESEIMALADNGSGSQNQAPVAVLDSDRQTGPAPLTINFSGTNSSDADGSIQSYAWTFGNGQSSTASTATVTYDVAGTFTAELTVTDDLGATSSTSQAIIVTATGSGTPPRAEITETIGRRSSLSISVSGETSTDPDGTIAQYSWSFGDGASGLGPAVTHDYQAAGSYPVILTVTDDSGLQASTTLWVSVYDALPQGTGSSLVGTARDQDPGFADFDGSKLTVRSPAAVSSPTLDIFRFVHKTVSGDGTITARIVSLDASEETARIGVMIRSQLTASATMAHLVIDGVGQVRLETRQNDGTVKTVTAGGAVGIPGWIRISRQGNAFRTFTSEDGAIWMQAGQLEIDMPGTVFMGITAASNSGNSVVTTLENVSFESSDDALPDGYLLSDAYPNPFNPSSQVSLLVDTPQNVRVQVYNVTGALVQDLFEGEVVADQLYEYRFVATDGIASGTYFLRVLGDTFVATRTVILLK